MPAVMAMLAEWDRRMEDRGIHDNCRCESLKLHMYVDGSGEITGTYTKVRQDMSEEEHLIAMLHGEDHVLLEFDSLAELHGALVAQVMTPSTQLLQAQLLAQLKLPSIMAIPSMVVPVQIH
jgi:hypothetical protein